MMQFILSDMTHTGWA